MQEGEKTGLYLQCIKGHSNWHTVKNKMHKTLNIQQSRALRAYTAGNNISVHYITRHSSYNLHYSILASHISESGHISQDMSGYYIDFRMTFAACSKIIMYI